MFVLNPRDAIVFHARATDLGGLVDPTRSAVIRPSFGLAVRVDNRGMSRDCWENVTATVLYGGKVVGWGAVPDFCAEKRGSAEVEAAMSHADVVLTDAQRYSMALQLATGELEFEVEMRMLLSRGYMDRSCGGCLSRQGFQFCAVNPGRQAYSRCQFFHLLGD
ncbi:unnamed protein product [Urochloa humidicola]